MNISKKTLQISKKNETPFLIIDQTVLINNCNQFKKNFSNFLIYYSIKANNTNEVLKILIQEDINFEIASLGEMQKLQELNVPPDRIIFSAPTKLSRDIELAYKYGITTYTFDSLMEVEKIAKFAPKSNILGRIIVDNTGSEWPLVGKFGMTISETLDFFLHAKKIGLNPLGLSFHVGSQNLQPDSWEKALEKVHHLWEQLQKKGVHLSVINAGGGFPVHYTKDIPSVEVIASKIKKTAEKLFKDQTTFYIEPGRRMLGDAGILVASVINRTKRGEKEWLYLDTGVYHGFQETIEGFRYEVFTEKTGEDIPFVLCGPTCDSTDIIMKEVLLPDTVTLDDRLYFLSCGAYTTSYEAYNGYGYPETIIV